MQRRPYGPEAWLVEQVEDPAGWALGLRARLDPMVREVVPAQNTVLVTCARADHRAVGETLDGVVAPSPKTTAAPPEVIDVRYDGADLAAVADLTGLSVERVIALHHGATYTVAFCGFSPGFAYLTGLDERLQIPRRQTPRTSVPAGSVAIAAEYSCIYPSASPGGWHLLGATTRDVWNIDRDPPGLLQPGSTVRFRPVEA